MSNYEFIGHDWTELAYCWGIVRPGESYNEEEVFNAILDYMSKSHDNEYVLRHSARDIRNFLRALQKESSRIEDGDKARMWLALHTMKNDDKLIEYCKLLLKHMWT
jgi:hypothetical protein